MQMNLIPPQSGTAFILRVGEILTVVDPEGGQVADLFCVEISNKKSALSSGRSIDYNDTIKFTTGNRLYSFSGEVLLEITSDSCKTHDFLVTPCSLQMFQMLDPECLSHPSCQSNLFYHMQRFAVDASVIGTTFNIFMNVPVKPDGSLKVEAPTSKAGDHISFRARKDLIVGLTACADEGSNNGKCKPILYSISKEVFIGEV